MSRSSARRAQVEPLPALVAVAVVCLAVGAYAVARANALPASPGHAPADAVLADAVDAATGNGETVVDSARLDALDVTPTGYEASVTVRADGREWRAGASNPPPDAATASEPVAVRVPSGRVLPGRLVVEVWA